MPRRRNTRGGRRTRATTRTILDFDFSSTFAGNSKLVNFSDLGVDASRPVRVAYVRCDAAIVGATQYPTFFLTIQSNGNETVAYSRPITLGVSPRSVSVRNFRGADFHLPASNETVCYLLLKNYYNGQVTISGTVGLDVWRRDVTSVVKAMADANAYPRDDESDSSSAVVIGSG